MLCLCLISKEAFITCRCNAYCVSEMFSRFERFLENICRHASFTFSWILTQSYKAMMNLAIILNCQEFSSNIEKRLYITQRNDSLFIGNDFDASHANTPGFSVKCGGVFSSFERMKERSRCKR